MCTKLYSEGFMFVNVRVVVEFYASCSDVQYWIVLLVVNYYVNSVGVQIFHILPSYPW